MSNTKLLIVCIGLLFLTTTTFSQSIGIKAGPVYNHFISSQYHVKGNVGLVAGISFNYDLSDKLTLSSAAEYLQLGGGLLTIEDNTRYGEDPYANPFAIQIRDSRVTLHTVNVPIILKYGIIGDDNVKVNIGIGPEVSYTFYGTSNDVVTLPSGGSNLWVTYTQTVNETNNYAPFNLAATAALGVDFMAGSQPLGIDFRYRYGVLPIREGYSYLDLNEFKSDVNQGSFIVTIEYKFNLNKE